MIDIGSVCMKIAGRDAGKICVVVDMLDGQFVLIDGQTRRKRCNNMHLEPLSYSVDIKKGASSDDVAAALEKKGVHTVKQQKKKQIKTTEGGSRQDAGEKVKIPREKATGKKSTEHKPRKD